MLRKSKTNEESNHSSLSQRKIIHHFMENNHVEMNCFMAMHDQILHLQNQLQELHQKRKLQPMHWNYKNGDE
jgi:hypothetical protein